MEYRQERIAELQRETDELRRDIAERRAREAAEPWHVPHRPAIVCKAYVPPAAAPVSRTLTAEEMQPWEQWAAERECQLMDVLGDETGKALAHERRTMREHVAEAIGQLRAEHEAQVLALRAELSRAKSEPRGLPLPNKPGLRGRHAH